MNFHELWTKTDRMSNRAEKAFRNKCGFYNGSKQMLGCRDCEHCKIGFITDSGKGAKISTYGAYWCSKRKMIVDNFEDLQLVSAQIEVEGEHINLSRWDELKWIKESGLNEKTYELYCRKLREEMPERNDN